MRAMVLKEQKKPLVLEDVPKPSPKENDLLIKVLACGVCRTDLHILDGDLPDPKLPIILGHEIVGLVEEVGKHVQGFQKGDRVGIPWLGTSCGKCSYCREEQENLCEEARYTGYQIDGGFADYTLCRYDYAVHLPPGLSDLHIAPLLCAGLIGYRAYRKASPKKTLGLYGFGAAAHVLTQIAAFQGKEIYAFTREADQQTQDFARRLGAVWAGDSTAAPPTLLDAGIIFAPLGELVPFCLKALKKGGRCICGGIHMSDIPSFPYKDLWGEKSLSSIANLTRRDAKDFFAMSSSIPLRTEIHVYPLEKANEALDDLRNGKFQGAAVLETTAR